MYGFTQIYKNFKGEDIQKSNKLHTINTKTEIKMATLVLQKKD